jgi:FkbM family methyltransferase
MMSKILKNIFWRIVNFRQTARYAYWHFFHNNWPAGKIIELMGNKGHLGELTFDLSNPHIQTHLKSRFLFHTYEDGHDKSISHYLNPELPVVEFGGCIGVVSCFTNRLLKDPQRHVVIEAQPFLIPTLEKNRDQNGCQFKIINAAVAYRSDYVDFWINPVSFIGNSTKAGKGGQTVKVATTSLKQILDTHGFDRISLIVDIEGAETELVDNELDLMQKVVETLIIELHSRECDAGPVAINNLKSSLAKAGFMEVYQEGNDYVYKNNLRT